MSAVLLAAHDLAVGRDRAVLSSVTFAVGAGECWCVVGNNGVGKSTLLLTLLGLLPPLAGRVERAPAIADRSALAFVPQEARYGRALPVAVFEFVALVVQQRCARHERRARTAAALAAVGLARDGHRPLAELSVGMRRRALVARALARRPLLLVLDEPTAGLDAPAGSGLCELLDEARRATGTAILHVAHDLGLVARFASWVLHCGAGRTTVHTPSGPWQAPAAEAR